MSHSAPANFCWQSGSFAFICDWESCPTTSISDFFPFLTPPDSSGCLSWPVGWHTLRLLVDSEIGLWGAVSVTVMLICWCVFHKGKCVHVWVSRWVGRKCVCAQASYHRRMSAGWKSLSQPAFIKYQPAKLVKSTQLCLLFFNSVYSFATARSTQYLPTP